MTQELRQQQTIGRPGYKIYSHNVSQRICQYSRKLSSFVVITGQFWCKHDGGDKTFKRIFRNIVVWQLTQQFQSKNSLNYNQLQTDRTLSALFHRQPNFLFTNVQKHFCDEKSIIIKQFVNKQNARFYMSQRSPDNLNLQSATTTQTSAMVMVEAAVAINV